MVSNDLILVKDLFKIVLSDLILVKKKRILKMSWNDLTLVKDLFKMVKWYDLNEGKMFPMRDL